MQVPYYAKINDLVDDPAFSWWYPTYLRKWKRIIYKIKYSYWKRTHKYGIQFLKSVEEDVQIDTDNNITLWQYSMDKEITNNSIVFNVKEEV